VDVFAQYERAVIRARTRAALGVKKARGERVGSVGCTGSCFGDHLHFEVHRGRGTQAPPIDPLPLLTRLKRPR